MSESPKKTNEILDFIYKIKCNPNKRKSLNFFNNQHLKVQIGPETIRALEKEENETCLVKPMGIKLLFNKNFRLASKVRYCCRISFVSSAKN